MDFCRFALLCLCLIVSTYHISHSCPVDKFCREKYETSLKLYHQGIIMCPYMSDYLSCFVNMSDVCNVTTTPAEHHEIGDTLEDKCEHETTVATADFTSTPLWWVDLIKEIPGSCGTVDTCVKLAISQPDFYSCSTVLSTLDCVENHTSALCLSTRTGYLEEDVKIHKELDKDCHHCVQGSPCPAVAAAVLVEHMKEPPPCSKMERSLASIPNHIHAINETMAVDLHRHYKQFEMLFTALCGTETLRVDGRLLILATFLHIVYSFVVLNEC